MRQITINELEQLFSLIIKKLKSNKINIITIEQDFYNIIPTDEWTSFDENSIVVGSLFDDVDSIINLLNDKSRPTTYVDFDRVATILRYISEKQNPT